MAHEASKPVTGAPTLRLRVLGDRLAVARLDPHGSLPAWLPDHGLVSVTRTQNELSIVCDERAVAPEVQVERGFRAFEVAGPLAFALTGVLASLLTPLAQAGIAILAIGTFDTDYVLVRADRLADAIDALEAAGHTVDR